MKNQNKTAVSQTKFANETVISTSSINNSTVFNWMMTFNHEQIEYISSTTVFMLYFE